MAPSGSFIKDDLDPEENSLVLHLSDSATPNFWQILK